MHEQELNYIYSAGECLNFRGVFLLFMLAVCLMTVGCSGNRTFHEYARAGDTVAVAAGWAREFTAENIVVTITQFSSSPVIYLPGNPGVRAVVNMYVDPLSSLVVSRDTGTNQTPGAKDSARLIQTGFTNDDKDWWQTVVFIDLPQSLSPGEATIDILNARGDSASSTLEIIAGAGQPNSFDAGLAGPLTGSMLDTLSRTSHYTVDFSGQTIPASIQLDIPHGADENNGGVGMAHVVNPIGYIKNLAWSDDGYTTRVLLSPARESIIQNMTDFKFYIAGGIENLPATPADLKAFDASGVQITGVTATITHHD